MWPQAEVSAEGAGAWRLAWLRATNVTTGAASMLPVDRHVICDPAWHGLQLCGQAQFGRHQAAGPSLVSRSQASKRGVAGHMVSSSTSERSGNDRVVYHGARQRSGF